MRKYFYFTAILILTSVIMISCSKVGGEAEGSLDAIDLDDNVFPVITVSKPGTNQVYISGDSIIVEGKVTDDKKLYRGKVQIKNDADNLVMADSFYETHFLPAINFRLAYKATVTTPADFSILIEFRDHGDNVSTATIKVKVNP
jgi:hypothetical protein